LAAECQPLRLAGPQVLGDRHLRVRHGRRRRRRWWGGRRSEPAAWGVLAAWRVLVVAATGWGPERWRSSPPVRAWAAIRVRGAAASMCVRFEHATAAHAVASEPAELLAGKRVVERGARLPAALEGAGVLGHREQGEQGEQGNACQPHPGRSRSWGVGDHDLQRGRAEGCVVGDTGMEPATSGSAGHSSTQPRHWGTRRWMPASTARARRACACAEPVMQAELEGFACARGAA